MKIKKWIGKVLHGPQLLGKRLWRGRFVLSDLFKHEHRFVVLDTETYKEKVSFRLSGLNLFVTFGIVALVLVVLTAVLLAFTPLRELIPGYTNSRMVQQTYANAKTIQTIEAQLKAQEELLADIQDVMMGKDPAARHTVEATTGDTAKVEATPYVRSRADSLLRDEMESRGGDAYYALPLEGKVTDRFDSRNHQYGVEVSGKSGSKVLSAQGGIILLSDLDAAGVVTMVVQHWGGDVTIYKCLGKRLKKEGDEVDAGEPLVQIAAKKGDDEAHLYFAIRRSGEAVDPLPYFKDWKK